MSTEEAYAPPTSATPLDFGGGMLEAANPSGAEYAPASTLISELLGAADPSPSSSPDWQNAPVEFAAPSAPAPSTDGGDMNNLIFFSPAKSAEGPGLSIDMSSLNPGAPPAAEDIRGIVSGDAAGSNGLPALSELLIPSSPCDERAECAPDSLTGDSNQLTSPIGTELMARKIARQTGQPEWPDSSQMTSPVGSELMARKLARQMDGGTFAGMFDEAAPEEAEEEAEEGAAEEMTLERLFELAEAANATDLEITDDMVFWSEAEAVRFFESGGVERPAPKEEAAPGTAEAAPWMDEAAPGTVEAAPGMEEAAPGTAEAAGTEAQPAAKGDFKRKIKNRLDEFMQADADDTTTLDFDEFRQMHEERCAKESLPRRHRS